MSDRVLQYIRDNYARSVYRDQRGSGLAGVDLPHPYTSPCIMGEGHFAFFFYWDTAFTNYALYALERADLARSNIGNMLWLIRRYGYMPNHVGIANRSQPPYLCQMVTDYFASVGGAAKDPEFFEACADGLRREYQFWSTARQTATGLQRYGHHATTDEAISFYDQHLIERLGVPADAGAEEKAAVGWQGIAEAETGWDFTPRFGKRCLDYNAVDLNGLLYGYETWLAEAAEALGWSDAGRWRELASRRRARIQRYLWDEAEGWFFDYDFVRCRRSEVASLGAFNQLLAGVATPAQAEQMRSNLPRFERAHGVAVTDDRRGDRSCQWAYPNVWPPMVYVTVESLRRYGFASDAQRIAGKFVDTTRSIFKSTGRLWEKTDAETGEIADGEYPAAAMIGWTAGVYAAMLDAQG